MFDTKRRGDEVAAVILAAGWGTRMRSRRPKVLHPVAGRPMIERLLDTVAAAGLGEPWVVVRPDDGVAEAVAGRARPVVQAEMRGTGDAVLQAVRAIGESAAAVLVLYGDCPLVPPTLLRQLIERFRAGDAAGVMVTAMMDHPSGYGRILRDAGGRLLAVVEEAEATPQQRAVREINSGLGIWRVQTLRPLLEHLPWHGQERYFTDAVAACLAAGEPVDTLTAEEAAWVQGINTRAQLADAEAFLRRQSVERLLAAGVSIIDPATTFIDPEVEVGPDTVIEPMTVLRGRTVVGRDCRLGPMTTIVDSRLGDGVLVYHSVLEDSELAEGCRVGPFSHLRAGSRLAAGVHLGNFVEVKNSWLGAETKAGHHSYLGDATIGTHVNIGAGTVIVNYDGIRKHPTRIGDHAFVGCNVNLVAPIEIGAGAFVAAGSTLTDDVPEDALAVARARQVNKPEWVRRRSGLGDRGSAVAAPSSETGVEEEKGRGSGASAAPKP